MTLRIEHAALDRVQHRRLVLMIRKQITKAMEMFDCSWNDADTRAEVKDVLSTLLACAPIYDWVIVCDETNNPASAVENNRLHVDIAIKYRETDPFVYMHSYTPGHHSSGTVFSPPTDLSRVE